MGYNLTRYVQLLDADALQNIALFPFGLFPEIVEKGETMSLILK
jgi:hypothetical protein